MDLDRMIAAKRELWALPVAPPAPRVERHRPLRPGRFTAAVSGRDVGIVVDARSVRLALAYESGGAAGVSVPADEVHLGGGPELVRRVAGAVDVPVLFADVVVDVRQVDMAYACGADAVLVTVRAVDHAELADIVAVADGLGIDALVSTTDEEDVERALDAGAALVGLTHDSSWLRALVPAGVPVVMESEVRDRGDVERVAGLGFTGCVVGPLPGRDPAAAVRGLTGVPTGAGAVR
ncbi:hypothetical protein [Actinophytocola sp.]|uniref:hypothetical protein n=1 Tax=Actinophytocola sp. TaxID=1872138 RepID=UPI0025C210D3|nr:hypothetical protein [Actinophytocola sp.]